MIDPVQYNRNSGKYRYSLGGKMHGDFKTKREAGTTYVKHLIVKEPKYKPLFEGKDWGAIFKMVGIVV